MKTVRRLNELGRERFSQYWQERVVWGDRTPALSPPHHLLGDPTTSTETTLAVELDDGRHFGDKMEFGRYLARQLEPLQFSGQFERDAGLWSWIALLYFDQICLPGSKPKARHRYIFSQDYRYQYRHLVRSPCLAYLFHGENAQVVLQGHLYTHGEASEQLLSRQHIFANRALFRAMNLLYLGPDKRRKRGVSGNGRGSLRRLGKVLRQFDLTYDFQEMEPAQILELLPPEFDRFRPSEQN